MWECTNMVTSFQELKGHLLYYKNFNADCDYGLAMYSELPKIRQNLLENL